MCYMLAAGKKATLDGSVLVGRNCDAVATMATQLISVPAREHSLPSLIQIPSTIPGKSGIELAQVARTYAYTAVVANRKTWEMPMVLGGINQYQVSAGASTGALVNDKVEKISPWPETVVGDFMMTLVLERCKTAREGVELVGSLTETYGARGDIYILADPQEAWLIEQYQGFHWAAARVPDDCFVVMANSFRLAEIHPEDSENYLCAPDLLSFAETHALWNPKEGPFHASRAYGTHEMPAPRNYPSGYTGSTLRSHGNQLRVWGGIQALKPSAGLDALDPAKDYPLFWQPDQALKPADILRVLKSYYPHTEFDEYHAKDQMYPHNIEEQSGHYRYAPVWGKARLIGTANTVTSWVTQSRAWLPNLLGGVLFAGLAAAPTSPHVPFYACSTHIPVVYQKGEWLEKNRFESDSAYWLFENIGNLTNLFYQALHVLVEKTWMDYEQSTQSRKEIMEQAVLSLLPSYPEEAAKLLSDFSYQHALEAYERGNDLLGEIFTRLALLNTPQTALQFQNPADWKLTGMVH